jgi:hypothetical protein
VKFGNSNQTLIRHDFKRAVYRVMLSEFSIKDILTYFSKVPLVINGNEATPLDLFELLWSEKAKIPQAFDIATDNELEPFLISMGWTLAAFMKKILWLNNQSSVMPGKVLLQWFYPKLESLFSSLDSRDIAFTLISLHNENWAAGIINRRIKKWEDGEWVKSTMVFIPDTSYKERLDWDLDGIGGPQFLAGPGMIGMPHFEKNGMLSDTRHAERVIWRKEDVPIFKDSTILIGGEPYGKEISFFEFCANHGIDLGKFKPPDLTITEMERDYYCPERKRIVLYRGCAYGAPLYLHTIEHRKLLHEKKAIFGNLVSDLTREEEMEMDELEAKHRALLESISEKSEFMYFNSDESINLNGSNFIKGISAKILKYLLETYLNEGRSEFEYRELKRQFDITLGQKHANFEVRFYRLVDKLENDCAGFKIEKTGRGKFRLKVKGQIQFESRID